jgi:hypothetical protein
MGSKWARDAPLRREAIKSRFVLRLISIIWYDVVSKSWSLKILMQNIIQLFLIETDLQLFIVLYHVNGWFGNIAGTYRWIRGWTSRDGKCGLCIGRWHDMVAQVHKSIAIRRFLHQVAREVRGTSDTISQWKWKQGGLKQHSGIITTSCSTKIPQKLIGVLVDELNGVRYLDSDGKLDCCVLRVVKELLAQRVGRLRVRNLENEGVAMRSAS